MLQKFAATSQYWPTVQENERALC